MSGQELDEFFAGIEKSVRTDVSSWEDDEEKPVEVSPDLYSRESLEIYLLLEEFKSYPNIRIMTEPVERWPRTLLRDIRTIRYAHGKAREHEDVLDTALEAMGRLKDPETWG